MPVRSRAQLRWLFWAEEQGMVPKGTARRWLNKTKKDISELPKYVNRKRNAITRRLERK